MNLIGTTIRMYVLMTCVLGLAYPFAVTGFARTVIPGHAGGALISRGDRVVGSRLIAQNFTTAAYVHPRPSAIGYDPMNSGASNLSVTSAALAGQVKSRDDALGAESTPALLHASGSGLDPDLDLSSAFAQVPRVARARGLTEERVRSIIDSVSQPRQFGVFGEPRVNVLVLNLALDESR